MITDNIKSIFLVFLVLLSLILTFFLWYGTLPYEDTEIVLQEAFFFEEPRDHISAITPSLIVLPFENEEFVVCRRGTGHYREIWKKIQNLLTRGSGYVVTDNDIMPETPSAMIYFDPVFPLQPLEYLPDAVITHMEKMYLYLNNREATIFLENGREGVLIKFNDNLTAEDIEKSLNEVLNSNTITYGLLKEKITEEATGEEETEITETEAEADEEEEAEEAEEETEDVPEFRFNVSGDIYLPVDDLYVYPEIFFDKEQIPTDELLKAVFVNDKLARRIEGPDGTLIFTDGEKGLSISENVEYTAPGLEKGGVAFSYRSAVQKANEYICYYGGWPEDLYLADISAGNYAESFSGSTYHARWLYYCDGFPVIGNGGKAIMEFNDRGLYYYKRSLFIPGEKPEEKIRVIPGEDALKRSFEFYVENNNGEGDEITFNVNNVYMTYCIEVIPGNDRARANPVWAVHINDEIFYLDVSDLMPVRPEEYDEYF